MDRSEQHKQGYRHAAKDAVEFLLERARGCNDGNAKAILNSAAFTLGQYFSYVSKDGWSESAAGRPMPTLKQMARP